MNNLYVIADLFRGLIKLVRAAYRLLIGVWRFLTGAALDGKERTDATWTERGSAVFTRTGRTSWWHYQSRLVRAGIRLGALVWAWITWEMLQFSLVLTFVIYLAAGLAAAGYGAVRWWRARLRRKFDQAVVMPLYQAIRHKLGVDSYPESAMSTLLIVPMNYATDPAMRIVLALPASFGADNRLQAELSRIVQSKLNIELDGHWSMVGQPYVEWSLKPEPPSKVLPEDIEQQMQACADGEAVLGLGARSETVEMSLNVTDPHLGMSVDTGGGKSSTLRGLIAQYIRQGAEVVICDPGGGSLQEFEGVPGVTIVSEIRDIWDIYDRVADIMEERYAERRKNPDAKFRRLIVVLEEGNDFYLQSKLLWNEIKKKGDPAEPPFYAKKARLMVKARKIRIHFWDVYQLMEARYVGGQTLGPLIRSQYTMKILVRWSVNVWKFLIGTTPVPRSSKHPGRGVVASGMDVRQCQFAYWTPEEARAYALGDREPASVTSEEIVASLRQEGGSVTDVTDRPSLTVIKGGRAENDAAQDVDDPEIDDEYDEESDQEYAEEGDAEEGEETAESDDDFEIRDGATVPAPPRRYTLAEAAKDREGIVPLSAGALRQAKHAAKTKGEYFPVGRTTDGVTTYTRKELETWYANRQRAAVGE